MAKINTVKVTERWKVEKDIQGMHIVSNVEGKLNEKKSKIDTLLAGFPAGNVYGAPKSRAMEIIDELEKSKRKMYAGAIGYFSANQNFDTCIALRTALIKNNKFFYSNWMKLSCSRLTYFKIIILINATITYCTVIVVFCLFNVSG